MASSLPVLRRDGIVVSCWRVPWRERLAILFGARIWLHVASGSTQPAVAMTVERVKGDRHGT